MVKRRDAGNTRAPSALTPMRHPERIGCSFAGHEYSPGADGVVFVPIEAVQHLMAHRFLPAEETERGRS